MTHDAQQTQLAFARLAGDSHSLLYFDDFLRHGFNSWPDLLRRRHCGLSTWHGLLGLHESVKWATAAGANDEVLFTSRTASLMRLAAKHASLRCERILVADLLWAPYRRILFRQFQSMGKQLHVCRLRRNAYQDGASSAELAQIVIRNYLDHDCDGLVLPTINHLGVRLPVETVASELRKADANPHCFVVDGSQSLGHEPIRVRPIGCDLFIAGAHKWLGGYHPLGIGIASEDFAARLTTADRQSDPTLRLTQEAIGRVSYRHGETSPLLPLLTAAAALASLCPEAIASRMRRRLQNRHLLLELLNETPYWRPVPQESTPHGIVLVRPVADRLDADRFCQRRALARHGVAVTQYTNGALRLSMPAVSLGEVERRSLELAFADCLNIAQSRSVSTRNNQHLFL